MGDNQPPGRRRSTGQKVVDDELASPSTSTPHSFLCNDCERSFDSSKAMRVHAFRRHNAPNSEPPVATSKDRRGSMEPLRPTVPTSLGKRKAERRTIGTVHSIEHATASPLTITPNNTSLSSQPALINKRFAISSAAPKEISKTPISSKPAKRSTHATASPLARSSSLLNWLQKPKSPSTLDTPTAMSPPQPPLNSSTPPLKRISDIENGITPVAYKKPDLFHSGPPQQRHATPLSVSTLSLNGMARSKSLSSLERSSADTVMPEKKKANRQKLIALSGEVVKKYFEETTGSDAFRRIFSKEEIENIKESIYEYRRMKVTSATDAWEWTTEEKMNTIINSDVKSQISICVKEELKKRPRMWNEQLKRFAPHSYEAISQAAYFLDFFISHDARSFVYLIDVGGMLKSGRGWSVEQKDEKRDARDLVEEEWIDGNGRRGRRTFIKIRTTDPPEYFIAIGILKGGLEKEEIELWNRMIQKGTNTLDVSERIRPKEMDQWVLHRMRRKEIRENQNLQMWETVLAEMEISKVVDRRIKAALRAALYD